MLLGRVLDDAVRQGQLSRNVAKLVERPHQVKKDMRTWTETKQGPSSRLWRITGLSAAFQLSLVRPASW